MLLNFDSLQGYISKINFPKSIKVRIYTYVDHDQSMKGNDYRCWVVDLFINYRVNSYKDLFVV